jgi:hypothetical protein
MAIKFTSLAAFADFVVARGLPEATNGVLKEVARQTGDFIIEEIHRVIGTYEYGWTPLKPQTVARKATGDSPLLETGKLKASYTYRIFKIKGGYRVRVSSTMPEVAFAHEFGTTHVPPRPVITPAVEKVSAKIQARLGPWTTEAMTTGRVSVQVGRS